MNQLSDRLKLVFERLADDQGSEFRERFQSIASSAASSVDFASQAESLLASAHARNESLLEAANNAHQTWAGHLDDLQQQAATLLAGAESNAVAANAKSDDVIAAAERRAQQLRGSATAANLTDAERQEIDAKARQVVDEARATGARFVADAQAAMGAAQASLDAERQKIESELAAVTQEMNRISSEIERYVNDRASVIEEKIQELTAHAGRMAGQLTGLPSGAVPLAQGVLEELVNLRHQQGSLIGLITYGLVRLNETWFKDDDRLQVVAFQPPVGAAGVGLSWVEGESTLLFAYSPDQPGPRGSFVIRASGNGADPIKVQNDLISLTVTGAGSNDTVISLDDGMSPESEADILVELELESTTAPWPEPFNRIAIRKPKASVRARTVDNLWKFRFELSLEKLAWNVTFADILRPMPNLFPVSGFTKDRSYQCVLEDGIFSFRESQ